PLKPKFVESFVIFASRAGHRPERMARAIVNIDLGMPHGAAGDRLPVVRQERRRLRVRAVHGFTPYNQAGWAEAEKLAGAARSAVDLRLIDDHQLLPQLVPDSVIEGEPDRPDRRQGSNPVAAQGILAYHGRCADRCRGSWAGKSCGLV